MRLYISLEKPYHWATVDRKSGLVDRGEAAELDQFRPPAKVEEIVGVAPGEFVTVRSAEVPGKRINNVQSALPYALEESLTEDVDDLHFALLDWEPEKPAKAAIVSRQQLKSWIEHFRLHGMTLDHVVPDYFLLPLHPKGALTVALTPDNRVLVRESRFDGYSMEPDLFEVWWNGLENRQQQAIASNNLPLARNLIGAGGEDVSHWEIGDSFPKWLGNSAEYGDAASMSLLTGNFLPRHRRQRNSPIKAAAVIGLVAFLGYWGYSIYEYNKLRLEERQLEREMAQLFVQTFPGEEYLYQPRRQVEGLLNRARTGSSAGTDFQLFMEAVRRVTPAFNATVNEIGFRDESMVVLCTVSDLSTLDRIRQAFDKLDGVTAELLSSGARDNQITGRFRLRKA
ncbi:MAG: type II secretion system protein GspL [Pseudomonadota bacterium]